MPQTPPAPDPQGQETERALEELRKAARAAGIGRDSPMMPLLSAFANAIRLVGSHTAAASRSMAAASQHVTDTLALARSTADAEHDRFQAGLDATKATIIDGIANAVARHADAALARRVRRHDYRTLALICLGLIVLAGGCFASGHYLGRSDALASVRQTEAGLRAAFTESPADAETWLNLMTWNSGRNGLDRCLQPGMTYLENGRKACNVPLWIEPPKPTTPP